MGVGGRADCERRAALPTEALPGPAIVMTLLDDKDSAGFLADSSAPRLDGAFAFAPVQIKSKSRSKHTGR